MLKFIYNKFGKYRNYLNICNYYLIITKLKYAYGSKIKS